MKKPVSVRRQKQENNQVVDVNTPQLVEEILSLQNQLAIVTQVSSNQQSLLDEISTLAIAQQKAGACFAETRQAQAELMELVISLQQDIREIKKNNLSVSEQNQSILTKLGHLSLLENIFAEVKQLKNSGRDDLKSILNILLNKKQDIDTERTISFQLGKTLIESKKSIESLMHLPTKLISIFDDSKERKEKKITAPEIIKTVKESVKPIAIEPKKAEVAVINNKIDISVENPLIAYDYMKNHWPKTQKKARFITILDEISENSWTNEFTLFPLNKNNYQTQIGGSTSNALFIESCWKGNQGAWEYAFTSPGLKHGNAQKLLESLSIAQKKEMPIIFWNKEDPMHYEKFLPIAEKCDIIFTTDENKVIDYKRDLPGKKVYALLFAANPYICNPINRSRYEQETICFAGSYYSVGHDDRKVQMDQLLPALLEFDGAIYDRMSSLNNERYFFPEQYRHLIRDAVDFKTMSVLYKKFKIFLNVNTITDSPTMMSRRVYELLACGTPVISTPSLALEKQFPNIVQIAKNADEAVKIAKELLSDEWRYRHISHLGYREVMLKHTYAHRVKDILNSIDISYDVQKEKVSILMATMREHFIDRILTNIKRQNYENIELIIVTQNFSREAVDKLNKELSKFNNLKHFMVLEVNDEMTLGSRLNKAAEYATGQYLAKMDDDDFYFENYLTDMIIPFSFGDFGLVGKKEIFIYLEASDKTVLRYQNQSHRVTDFVSGATLILTRVAFDKVGGFNNVNNGEDSSLIDKLKKENIAIYSSDPFNFVVWRGKDSQNHTWKVQDEFFLKNTIAFDGRALNKIKI